MRDEDGQDDHKVLFVPLGDPSWSALGDLDDVPGDLLQEIEHFFEVHGQLRGFVPTRRLGLARGGVRGAGGRFGGRVGTSAFAAGPSVVGCRRW